jgi:hypothetical protein
MGSSIERLVSKVERIKCITTGASSARPEGEREGGKDGGREGRKIEGEK